MRRALEVLEEEAIYILREVAGQFERPILLFSGGKDSVTLAHLAVRAFAPMPSPIGWLHIDTGHNFPETISFRNAFARELSASLTVRYVQDSIEAGLVTEETGPRASRNGLQSVTLMAAIRELKIDAAIGGARRDEERARAKERIFSHRDAFGSWEPRQQRPEVWRHFNGAKNVGEHFRVFPLSNWTEQDVWAYIGQEQLPLPALYFSHRRRVFWRDGVLFADTEFLRPEHDETVFAADVRFRTVGDASCTGAFESTAATIQDVIAEVAGLRLSERAGRGDDRRTDSAMEDRKRHGYF